MVLSSALFHHVQACQGRTENPRKAGRVPGGSSSGEAALAARHAVPFGIGTDIG